MEGLTRLGNTSLEINAWWTLRILIFFCYVKTHFEDNSERVTPSLPSLSKLWFWTWSYDIPWLSAHKPKWHWPYLSRIYECAFMAGLCVCFVPAFLKETMAFSESGCHFRLGSRMKRNVESNWALSCPREWIRATINPLLLCYMSKKLLLLFL